jgi:hypothetical protein
MFLLLELMEDRIIAYAILAGVLYYLLSDYINPYLFMARDFFWHSVTFIMATPIAHMIATALQF